MRRLTAATSLRWEAQSRAVEPSAAWALMSVLTADADACVDAGGGARAACATAPVDSAPACAPAHTNTNAIVSPTFTLQTSANTPVLLPSDLVGTPARSSIVSSRFAWGVSCG